MAAHEYRYYEYINDHANSSLLVRISDNNQQCAKLYLSKYEFPSAATSFLEDSDGTIIYENADKGRLYIGVEGLQECIYSIEVRESSSKITKILGGHFSDIQLAANTTKFLLYQHYSQSPFKVVSLLEYGNTRLSAQPIPLSQIDFSADPSIADPAFKTIYPNILNVDSTDPHFCGTCFYLIAVEAEENVRGSVVVTSSHSRLKFNGHKTLFDELSVGDSTLL